MEWIEHAAGYQPSFQAPIRFSDCFSLTCDAMRRVEVIILAAWVYAVISFGLSAIEDSVRTQPGYASLKAWKISVPALWESSVDPDKYIPCLVFGLGEPEHCDSLLRAPQG